MIRVLFAGAANLALPASGADMASRCHFEEISEDKRLDVTATSIVPFAFDPAVPPRYPVEVFSNDMLTLRDGRKRLLKKLSLLARGGILYQSGFLSERARTRLRARIAEAPDVLLVDQVGVLGSISLLQLLGIRLRGRTKVIIIAYDTTAEVLRDRAVLARSMLKAFLIRLHAIHCNLYENVVYALVHQVIFLSKFDRDRFGLLSDSKADVMCPIIDGPPAEPDSTPETEFGQYLVFIGSPTFFANAYAIDWITERFAPRLLERMPALKIVLIGKGNDRADVARPANIVGLGFVDEARLHRLLRHSSGLLSPVIHGSGIKIKVLETIASGCAVYATASSLRGYEFMGLDPVLDVDDPAASVERVIAIAGDSTWLEAYKQHIVSRWQSYKRERRGRLADTVCRLATGQAQEDRKSSLSPH